jgi:hypothetical protein
MSNRLHVPVDKMRVELEEIKQRQLDRKNNLVDNKKITNQMLYHMLYDILENQARLENKLNELSKRLN